MPQTITWSLSVQVSGGPTLAPADIVTVDAYDRVDVVVAQGAADEEVAIQPSDADRVRFLLISSDRYLDAAGDPKLTYKVNNAGADEIVLDSPQVFLGGGSVALLGADGPKSLFFSNDLGQDAWVQILVGRMATS